MLKKGPGCKGLIAQESCGRKGFCEVKKMEEDGEFLKCVHLKEIESFSLNEADIYDEEFAFELFEDDEIDTSEIGFMKGYNAA